MRFCGGDYNNDPKEGGISYFVCSLQGRRRRRLPPTSFVFLNQGGIFLFFFLPHSVRFLC